LELELISYVYLNKTVVYLLGCDELSYRIHRKVLLLFVLQVYYILGNWILYDYIKSFLWFDHICAFYLLCIVVQLFYCVEYL
jgi:hypothetical protein